VPQSDVQAFVDELLAANLGDSWSLIQFGGAVHSFTDPSASAAGQAEFNPFVSAKAFEAMDELMETLYGEDD
jgi:dienelactone hydrolase